MKAPTQVKVKPYGDGWEPLEGQCPWFNDDPDYFSPDNFSGKLWCVNSQDTSWCEFCVSVSDGVCICLYHLTPEEREECYERVRRYTEKKRPTQQPLFPELQKQGEEIPGLTCKCGSKTFVKTPKSPHVGVYCSECEKWQRWERKPIEHDPDFVVAFGKYKGNRVSKIPTSYLSYGSKEFKGSMKDRFRLALEDRARIFVKLLYRYYSTMTELDGKPVDIQELCELFQANHTVTDKGFAWWINYLKDNSVIHPYHLVATIDTVAIYCD